MKLIGFILSKLIGLCKDYFKELHIPQQGGLTIYLCALLCPELIARVKELEKQVRRHKAACHAGLWAYGEMLDLKAANARLKELGLNQMRHWRDALAAYLK